MASACVAASPQRQSAPASALAKLLALGCVDPEQANPLAVYFDGVAVDDPRGASQVGSLSRERQQDDENREGAERPNRPMVSLKVEGIAMKHLGRVVVLLALLWTGLAHAGPFEDGAAALGKGDYATALRVWKPLAEQGHAEAQAILGLMYGKGWGVPQDDAEAVKWYRRAAEQGLVQAQSALGDNYREGQGVSQDYAEAVKWYRRAAEQGHAKAQVNLGVMYHHGQGVPQDYVQAHKWFNLAASRYPANEKENRDSAVKGRDLVAAKMTAAQIAEAQRQAREWRPKSGEVGSR